MPEAVPGYPVPEGADDLVFPYSSAAIVNGWAYKAGNTEARSLLDEIRDWLGHPDRIMDLAASWSPNASTLIHDAKEGVLSARANLKAYWEGQAFGAFSTYIDLVTKAIDDTYGVMNKMYSRPCPALSGLSSTCRRASRRS